MLLIKLILWYLLPLNFTSNCLELKLSKLKYYSSDKVLKWEISNKCDETKYYVVGIQVKTDTGWRVLNNYVHALMQKDVKAVRAVKSHSLIADSISISRIKGERTLRGLDKEYTRFGLIVEQYDKKDFFSEQSSSPTYGYFEILN